MGLRSESARQRHDRVQKLLLFRQQLLELGEWNEQLMRGAYERGELVRVARGMYIVSREWQRLFAEERLLAATLAQARINARRGWIFTHESAAVLWGLPLWNLRSSRVHVATSIARPVNSSPRVMRRLCSLSDEDVVERFGVPCTSLPRTLVDLARSPNHEQALSAADAGLRHLFPSRRGVVPDGVAQWREESLATLASMAGRGVRSGARIIAMADPRADSPAESVSRLHLARLGVAVEIQFPITSVSGSTYWVDFDFAGQGILGEVDGRVKYLEPGMRGDATAEHVVLAEKAREDEIRGVSGKRIVRWQVEHLKSARALGERLQRFGVVVPSLRG